MMAGKENSAMTILMDFAKPCKGKLIGSVILAILGALCGMIPYVAVSRGIIMICHEDYAFSKLAFLALIAFTGYLGQVWFGTFSTMKSHESAFIILRNIRMAITEKLSRVPMGTILDTPSGKFKTIIVDTVEKLELPLAHMVPELTANILIPILMLIYLFSLDWRLALISLVTIPVGAFCYMGMMKDYEKRYARVLAAGKNMDAATVEYIGGIEVVKTFNQGERSYKKYADAVAENETAKATWFKQTNGYYVMGLSILTATLVGVLPLGSWLFINGRVEAGTLITCIILALGLVKPLIQALQYTDSLAMVDSTVKEVGNLLDEPELVRPTERAVLADTDVSFDHVTFRYKETEILHGISFDCAKNGMTAIVGPSGSGKSTIARLTKNAAFRYKAYIEQIDYATNRGLDRNQMERLATLDFVHKAQNLFITGSSGTGKSYLACALGHEACKRGFRTFYANAPKLLGALKVAKVKGTLEAELKKIERCQLLILDDLFIVPLDAKERPILLEIIEDRHERKSVIITSQYPSSNWYDMVGDPTIADAILDRIIHTAHTIELYGESMRKLKSKKNENF